MQSENQKEQLSESQVESKNQCKGQEVQLQKSPPLKSIRWRKAFKLTTSFGNQRLSIKLQDCIDWTIYQKEYTEADIGKEIHKRVILDDLHTSLISGIQAKSDEQKIEEIEKGDFRLDKYQFGDILQHKHISCYKIEKNGKLTVFVNFFDLHKNNNIVFESVLLLQKKMSMSEKEIMTHNFEHEKLLYTSQLMKKNKQLAEQNSSYKQTFAIQQRKDKRTYQIYKQFSKERQQLLETHQKIHDDYLILQRNVKQMEQKLRLTQPQIPISNPFPFFGNPNVQEAQKKQINELKIKLDDANKESNMLYSYLKSWSQSQDQMFLQNSEKTNKNLLFRLAFLKSYRKNWKQFRLTNKLLQYVGKQQKWTRYCIDYPLTDVVNFSFFVKMIRVTGNISVGITDIKNFSNISSQHNHCYIVYRSDIEKKQSIQQSLQCNKTMLYGLQKKKVTTNRPIKQGETIQIRIKQPMVQWYVGNTLLMQFNLDSILSFHINFIPVIEMYYPNDIVEILF